MKILPSQLVNSRYKLVRELGRGGFAEVWLAEDNKLNNIQVALKFYASEGGLDEIGLELFQREYLKTTELKNPHLLVPTYYDKVEESNVPFLVLPFCDGGSLRDRILRDQHFKESEIAKIIIQVGSGLQFLHSKSVLHRDIKPANILFSTKASYLLSDFGISKKLQNALSQSRLSTTDELVSKYGTYQYMSPEGFRERKEHEKGDIWSFGATLFELCCGEVPFDDEGGKTQSKGLAMAPFSTQYSNECKYLIERCLSMNPDQRPKLEQLINAANSFIGTGKWLIESFLPDYAVNSEKEKSNKEDSRNKGKTDVKETNILSPKAKETDVLPQREKKPTQEKIKDKKKPEIYTNGKRALWISLAATLIIAFVLGVFFWNSREAKLAEMKAKRAAEEQAKANRLAKEKEEDDYWNNMNPLNEINTYKNYLEKYPDGKYAENARNKIDALEQFQQGELKRQQAEAERIRIDKSLRDGIVAYNSKQYDKAIPLLRAAANLGIPEAQNYLGKCYSMGKADYAEAMKWQQLAADQGYAAAQWALSAIFYKNKNYHDALKWNRLAADQGHAHAQKKMGDIYCDGEIVAKDCKGAIMWYRLAADQGLADAQNSLGVMHDEGEGVTENDREAVKWYRLAANQGHAAAQYNLGMMYENGEGVTLNIKEAIRWFRKAADQGVNDAKEELSRLEN